MIYYNKGETISIQITMCNPRRRSTCVFLDIYNRLRFTYTDVCMYIQILQHRLNVPHKIFIRNKIAEPAANNAVNTAN